MESNLTPEQSLATIQAMVGKAKKSFQKGSIYFLLWGWLASASALVEFVLLYFFQSPFAPAVWPVMGIVGGITTGILASRSKKSGVTTYTDLVAQHIWTAYGVVLFITIVISVTNHQFPHPWILIITGIPTFTMGGFMKFKPLQFGAVAFWITGVLSFFLELEFVPLVYSIAMVLGYLIPGYLLKSEENKHV